MLSQLATSGVHIQVLIQCLLRGCRIETRRLSKNQFFLILKGHDIIEMCATCRGGTSQEHERYHEQDLHRHTVSSPSCSTLDIPCAINTANNKVLTFQPMQRRPLQSTYCTTPQPRTDVLRAIHGILPNHRYVSRRGGSTSLFVFVPRLRCGTLLL